IGDANVKCQACDKPSWMACPKAGACEPQKGKAAWPPRSESQPSGMTSSLFELLVGDHRRRRTLVGWGFGSRLSAGRVARQVKLGKKPNSFRAVIMEGIGTKTVGEVRPAADSS